MKLYLGLVLFVISVFINWTTAAPSADAKYLVGIRNPEFTTVSQSELFLMKIRQRIANALLLPEQTVTAQAIFQQAKENFQKCENEYFMSSLFSLYKQCLRDYMHTAMAQIHMLESEYMLSPSATALPVPMYHGVPSGNVPVPVPVPTTTTINTQSNSMVEEQTVM